jgi:hypothetical protein
MTPAPATPAPATPEPAPRTPAADGVPPIPAPAPGDLADMGPGSPGAPGSPLRIIEVIGDSMVPTLVPGQRVMVHLQDRRASPPGIFVLWDGLGAVIKRVEHIAHSDPPTLRITSDNKAYPPYERRAADAHILGRVISACSRL